MSSKRTCSAGVAYREYAKKTGDVECDVEAHPEKSRMADDHKRPLRPLQEIRPEALHPLSKMACPRRSAQLSISDLRTWTKHMLDQG